MAAGSSSWLASIRRMYTSALCLDTLEALKTRVRALDEGMAVAKRRVARARQEAEQVQREIRETAGSLLLHRKVSWTPEDGTHFSALCQAEIGLARREADLLRALAEAEDAADNSLQAFLSVLRERYQEEMAVGEMSRRLGYLLTGVNTLLFVVAFYDRREDRARSQRVEMFMENLSGKLAQSPEIDGGVDDESGNGMMFEGDGEGAAHCGWTTKMLLTSKESQKNQVRVHSSPRRRQGLQARRRGLVVYRYTALMCGRRSDGLVSMMMAGRKADAICIMQKMMRQFI